MVTREKRRGPTKRGRRGDQRLTAQKRQRDIGVPLAYDKGDVDERGNEERSTLAKFPGLSIFAGMNQLKRERFKEHYERVRSDGDCSSESTRADGGSKISQFAKWSMELDFSTASSVGTKL